MPRTLASLIGALAATTVLAGAGVAFAEPAANVGAVGAGYTSMDAPLGSSTELRIDLKGRVEARCDLVAPPMLGGVLSMQRAGQAEAGFKIDCNAPFILRVRSAEGGFASINPTPGIETLAPYQVSVAVRTDQGLQDLGWCDAAALTESATTGCGYAPAAAARGWSSGDATAINQTGSVRLRWDQSTDGSPRLGDYRDTIVIELEVRS
jgi:hypothetical protein